MEPPLWAWLALIGAVPVLATIDLLVFGRGAKEVPVRTAALWSAAWITLGLSFAGILGATQGGEAAGEYLSGYLIEWSLSIDNLFVFAVIFSYFAVPKEVQPRVLMYGILGALVFRGIVIAIGAVALGAAGWVIYVFGAFLIVTAYRLARSTGDHVDPSRNALLLLVNRFVPSTQGYHGTRVFVRQGGRRFATPHMEGPMPDSRPQPVTRRRVLLLGVAALLTASGLLAVAILLFGSLGTVQGRILGTTAILGGFGILALPAAMLLDQVRARRLAWALAALCAAGAVLSVAVVWWDGAPDALWRSALTATAIAVALTQTAGRSPRPRCSPPRPPRSSPTSCGPMPTACASGGSSAPWRCSTSWRWRCSRSWRAPGARAFASACASPGTPERRGRCPRRGATWPRPWPARSGGRRPRASMSRASRCWSAGRGLRRREERLFPREGRCETVPPSA